LRHVRRFHIAAGVINTHNSVFLSLAGHSVNVSSGAFASAQSIVGAVFTWAGDGMRSHAALRVWVASPPGELLRVSAIVANNSPSFQFRDFFFRPVTVIPKF
jgi:hypothetical protein